MDGFDGVGVGLDDEIELRGGALACRTGGLQEANLRGAGARTLAGDCRMFHVKHRRRGGGGGAPGGARLVAGDRGAGQGLVHAAKGLAGGLDRLGNQ